MVSRLLRGVRGWLCRPFSFAGRSTLLAFLWRFDHPSFDHRSFIKDAQARPWGVEFTVPKDLSDRDARRLARWADRQLQKVWRSGYEARASQSVRVWPDQGQEEERERQWKVAIGILSGIRAVGVRIPSSCIPFLATLVRTRPTLHRGRWGMLREMACTTVQLTHDLDEEVLLHALSAWAPLPVMLRELVRYPHATTRTRRRALTSIGGCRELEVVRAGLDDPELAGEGELFRKAMLFGGAEIRAELILRGPLELVNGSFVRLCAGPGRALLRVLSAISDTRLACIEPAAFQAALAHADPSVRRLALARLPHYSAA